MKEHLDAVSAQKLEALNQECSLISLRVKQLVGGIGMLLEQVESNGWS